MKTIGFILSFFALSGAPAQTLTQAVNEPAPGDTESSYLLDTTFMLALPTATGQGVTWDFSTAKGMNPLIVNQYISPDTSDVKQFPSASFVQQSGLLRTVFRSVTTGTPQTELLGLASSTLTLKLTNSAVVVRYPCSYGQSVTDQFAGSGTVTTFPANVNGNITTKAEGTGTLLLPGGISVTNVLRVRSVQTMTFFSGFIPLGTLRQVIVNYYHPPQRFPALSVTYQDIASITGSPMHLAAVNGSADYIVTGLLPDESAGPTTVFPNPASEILYLTRPVTGKCTLADAYGDTIAHEVKFPLLLQSLTPGVYCLIFENGKTIKFVKE